ncbi:hypothetical protein EsDP_00007394 [Epichloe bromicola]|uniref:Uncharacterized protein n=1 Tax=Epichloe bromicola TaxID=79588 RepID=A0ABQ0D0G7_9HYPO
MIYNDLPAVPSAAEIVLILERCVRKFQRIKEHLLATVTPETACFENVVLPWSQVADEVNTYSGMVWLLMYAAPVAETHESIRKASKIFNDALAGWTASRELFLLFEAAAKKDEALDEESRHLVQDRLQDFVNAGHGSLSSDQLETYMKNKLRLNDLKLAYMENLQQNQGGVWAQLSDLDGIPGEEVRKWRVEGADSEHKGEIFIPLANGGRLATLTYAKKEDLRKTMLLAAESKVPANVTLF